MASALKTTYESDSANGKQLSENQVSLVSDITIDAAAFHPRAIDPSTTKLNEFLVNASLSGAKWHEVGNFFSNSRYELFERAGDDCFLCRLELPSTDDVKQLGKRPSLHRRNWIIQESSP